MNIDTRNVASTYVPNRSCLEGINSVQIIRKRKRLHQIRSKQVCILNLVYFSVDPILKSRRRGGLCSSVAQMPNGIKFQLIII